MQKTWSSSTAATAWDLTHTSALAEVCAEHLVKTNHFGRANNGLVPVWQHANDQGAYELGILPDVDLVTYHQQRHGALPGRG